MGSTHRVAIIQPAVPHYRVPFFARLIAAARKKGIQIDVFGGEPPAEIRAREDTSDAPFIHPLKTCELTIRGTTLFYKSPDPILRGGYGLVILEHALRNIETYELLLRLKGRRVAFWGHGRTYTKDISSRQETLKFWLSRRATWFFGYTERSVEAVVKHGFPSNRTTVVNNAIDTAALRADLRAISDSDALEFSRHLDLRGCTALYLGGLDSYKRIPFLLDSAIAAHDLCPDFRLLIAGNGSDRALVEDFVAANPWASYLGSVHGRDKALALKVAQAVSIPGAIGLVSLDSMAAGTPIVTTDYRYHGPEFDYLTNGSTAVVTADDVRSYASGLISFLRNKARQQEMGERCWVDAQSYTLDTMTDNFLAGIISALG